MEMLNKAIIPAIAACLAVLLMTSEVGAYGAAHVGYTHVGPNGVYHTGETAAYGPRGAYAGGRTEAYGAGGAAYRGGHEEYRGRDGVEYGAAGGYRYTPNYGGAYRYDYIR
jgi:hypothetical protein